MKKIPETDFSKLTFPARAMERGERRLKQRKMKRVMQSLRCYVSEMVKPDHTTAFFRQLVYENIRNGFKGSYPDIRIDYTKLIVSKGKLPNAPMLSVCSSHPGRLDFGWTDNSGLKGALASDLFFIALFNCATQTWLFCPDAAKRSACRIQKDASPVEGKLVQVYAGFVSVDSNRLSTSQYLGEVRVMGGQPLELVRRS